MNPHIRISNEAGHTMFELDGTIVREKLGPVGLVELMGHLRRSHAVVNTTSLALLPLDAIYAGAWQEEHAGRGPVADVQWRFEERLHAAADQAGPLAVVMGDVNEGIAYQVLASCFGTPAVVVGVRKS